MDRRAFVKSSLVGVGALAAPAGCAVDGTPSLDANSSWEDVRAQFRLTRDRVHMAGFLLAFTFSFDDCADVNPRTATLLDEEGVTELAGTTAAPGECPNLTVDIPESGRYALHVASETAAPYSSGFSLHVEQAD